jgi:uncharacterized protein (PEP-CTERM system associated)
MGIMRNKPLLRLTLLASSLLPAWAAMAKNEFKPALDVSYYSFAHKSVDADQRDAAYSVNPSLNFIHSGDVMRTSARVGVDGVFYSDDVQSNEQLFSYSVENSAKLLNDAMTIRLATNQSHSVRQVGGRAERGRDQYNSPDLLSKQQSTTGAINFSKDINSALTSSWSVSLLESKAERPRGLVLGSLDTLPAADSLTNRVGSFNFDLNSQDRTRSFFWGIQGSGSKTSREFSDDIFNRSANVIVGVPFFYTIQMIGQASVEKTSGFSDTNISNFLYSVQNYRSVGGGLEWHFGRRSFWNITYNTILNGSSKKAYIGTAFDIKPSRRTKIAGQLERRFFGRSLNLVGEYNLQKLRMKLSASDQVGSLLGLSGADASTGLFVCPPGAVPSLDSCFQPPTANYVPQPGETYFNITNPGSDYSEFGIVRRSVDYSLGYDFQRLKLQLQVGQRKDSYLERDASRNEKFGNVSASWALQQHMDLVVSYSHSDSTSEGIAVSAENDYTGISNTWNLALNRQLSRNLSSSLMVGRTNNDFASTLYQYEENRIGMKFSYSFE